MKKIYLFIILVIIGRSLNAQTAIPNGNFETWIASTFEIPLYYPYSENTRDFFANASNYSITKVGSAYHGNYAVQITTIASLSGDTNTGFFANINPDNGSPTTWTGGMAYNQQPTGIAGYYKNNEMPGDSAILFVVFSKAGVNVGSYFFTLGGVHANWTSFDFNLQPALSVIPDSVAIGATSSNVLANMQIAGSTITLDSLSFTGVNSQPALMNGDFELWQTPNLFKPAGWYYDGDQNGDGMYRTNDAYGGSNYAIELKTYARPEKQGNQVNPGSVGTGFYQSNCQSNCKELGGYPFTNQLDTLAFYYKYAPSGTDTAFVSINFKKNGVQIWGTSQILLGTGTYRYMEVPFNTGTMPDTVMINLQSSSYNDTTPANVGSDLKIDSMYFKSVLATGLTVLSRHGSVVLYPNPVSTMMTLEIGREVLLQEAELRIYDVLGRSLRTFQVTDYKMTFEKDNLSSGMYFYEVKNNNELLNTGKLMVE